MPSEEKFGQLFDAYTFDAVWYVSGHADGGKGIVGETQFLERTIQECQRSQVEKVILLSSWDSRNYCEEYGKSGEPLGREYQTIQAVEAAQTEELGRCLAEKAGLKMIVLQLPYLAGQGNRENYLGSLFGKLSDGETVSFPGRREDPVDFLSWRDLAVLLCRITDEPEDESGTYFVGSGYQHSYGELEDALKAAASDGQICYEKNPNLEDHENGWQELRRQYGFIPRDDVMEDVGTFYQDFLAEQKNEKNGLGSRLAGYLKQGGAELFHYIEILAFFLLTEFIAGYTSESVYFQYVDVRLFFVIIVGTIYGMKKGILAAVLECLVLVRKFASIGIGGIQLFYNIENWLPFVLYAMAGAVTGYVKNKKTAEIGFLKKEYGLLRDKYLFLNNVYKSAVQNKGEYRRQILGFKDSFGKIFDAVQKLDGELPEKIFLDGLQTLEDILQNHTIAIYSLDPGERFGRLMVCSRSQIAALSKSLRLEDCREMYEQVKQGKVWKNTGMKEGYPMYAAGVFREQTAVLLITIQEAGTGQYGMDYINIFRIMCGLVQNSFLKALRYEELREAETYYPGTQIAYPARLRHLVAVQEDMRQAGVADYLLLRLEERDKEVVNRRLSGVIRATDMLGAAEDGTIYLVLVQANRQSIQYVEKRLTGNGISYSIAEKVD